MNPAILFCKYLQNGRFRKSKKLNDYGTPERIRTFGLRIRNPPLYPTELRGHAAELVAGRPAVNALVTAWATLPE